MIGLPAGTKVWLAAGATDMRSGFNGPAAKVQTALAEDPFSSHVFEFRGRRGNLKQLGEGVSKQLEYVPARFRVIHHVRPKLGVCAAEKVVSSDDVG